MDIDWPTGVITVYKTDTFMSLAGGSVYDMDTNNFRLAVLAQEAGEQGMIWPKVFNHNTVVTLGGIEYSRLIEMINGYTITFDDTGGGWVCNLVGSNNNFLDVANLTAVQIRSNNSAGLINVREIQKIVFDNAVHVDVTSPYSGTLYPIGTPLEKVNNFADARVIAGIESFSTLKVYGDATLGSGDDVSNFRIIGENAARTNLTINPASDTLKLAIEEASVTGTLDGITIIEKCSVTDLGYFNGFIFLCEINGTITLGAGAQAAILNCFSGQAGTGTPTIDMGGAGQSLSLRHYSGGVLLTNKTGPESASIDLSAGQVKIDLTTVTNGTIVVRGNGKVINAANDDWLPSGTYGSMTLINETNFGVMLQEIHARWGLDPDLPVNITDNGTTTTLTVGTMVIEIEDDEIRRVA